VNLARKARNLAGKPDGDDEQVDALWRGAVLILISEALLVLMSAVIKHIAPELPAPMLVFFRNLFGLVVVAPVALRHGPGQLATGVPYLHVLRALAGVGAMYCFFYTISHIALAEATLFKLTAPFFLPLIAWCWLGERIPVQARVAILLGFIGAALILRPGLRELPFAALTGLAGAALAALAKVAIRAMGTSEPPSRVVFYFATLATTLTAIPLLWVWQTPDPKLLAWLLLMGGCATIAQLCLTRAYSMAPAGQIGPFTYVSVVYACLLGWAIWGEVPALLTIAGSLLITAAGVATVRSGRRSAEPATHQPEATRD